jgi:hypothetical protein
MRAARFLAIVLTCTAVAGPAAAAPPAGVEFRISTGEISRPKSPALGWSHAGDAVAVWENERLGLVGRLYDHRLEPLAADVVLVANQNLPTIPSSGIVVERKEPAILFLPSRDFLLFWTEETSFLAVDFFFQNRVVQSSRILGQRFDLTGQPEAPRFVVSEGSDFATRPAAARLELPTLGPLAAGRILVAWQSHPSQGSAADGGIVARLIGDGGPLPSVAQTAVSAPGQGDLAGNAVVASDGFERFLVAWDAPDGVGNGVFARLYTVHRAWDRQQRLSVSGFDQSLPGVAYHPDGHFVVVWQATTQANRMERARLFGQLVRRGGRLIGDEFPISRGRGLWEGSPGVAVDADGRIRVVWHYLVRRNVLRMASRDFNAEGVPLAGESVLDVWTPNTASRLSLAAGPDDVMVAWIGYFERKLGVSGLVLPAP